MSPTFEQLAPAKSHWNIHAFLSDYNLVACSERRRVGGCQRPGHKGTHISLLSSPAAEHSSRASPVHAGHASAWRASRGRCWLTDLTEYIICGDASACMFSIFIVTCQNYQLWSLVQASNQLKHKPRTKPLWN